MQQKKAKNVLILFALSIDKNGQEAYNIKVRNFGA